MRELTSIAVPVKAVVDSPALTSKLELLMWRGFECEGAVPGSMTIESYECTEVARLFSPCDIGIKESHWHWIGTAHANR